jgi:hypothetical protein
MWTNMLFSQQQVMLTTQNLNEVVSSKMFHHTSQPKSIMGSFPKHKIAEAQRHSVILIYFQG